MKFIFNAIIILFLVILATGNVLAAPTSAAIENWAYIYPDAALELWSWSKEHPGTARSIIAWDKTNHEQSKMIVSWATTHPGEGIDVFMRDHANWRSFENVIKGHRSATKELLAWCRRYPGAVKALMKSPRPTLSSRN